MHPFQYQRATSPSAAIDIAGKQGGGPPTLAAIQYLAGGTTMLDLMKLHTMQPDTLVDINGFDSGYAEIRADAKGLQLGALARMADVADHPAVLSDYPVIAQSLQLAASAQLRNMATLGGNVLQRTRCNYFRDPSWAACNKRVQGSGCAALEGVNRKHAVLGVSDHCIATYPGDFAQALLAMDAVVEIQGAGGMRVIPIEILHALPGDSPHIETTLAPGDLITGFNIPASSWSRRSLYLKIRDRQSYEFALASAAVALDLDGGTVKDARIAVGGVATKPWRSREAETALKGKPLDPSSANAAADAAFQGAKTREGNAFKADLGRRTLQRALLQAATIEV
jgi:xanthine dehydrogenase YagS FAD-binding subunit